MSTKQQIFCIITSIIFSTSIMLVLYTLFIVNRELGNGIVSGKYFWFYASMALFTVIAIPAAIIKRNERVGFGFVDLLFVLFCFVLFCFVLLLSE